MTRRARRIVLVGALGLIGGAVACELNPQPLPPKDENGATFGDAGATYLGDGSPAKQTSSSSSGSSSGSSGSSGSSAPIEGPIDGATPTPDQQTDAGVDAASDAGPDAGS